jgi:hypothetical protein
MQGLKISDGKREEMIDIPPSRDRTPDELLLGYEFRGPSSPPRSDKSRHFCSARVLRDVLWTTLLRAAYMYIEG